jgi:hypothetical protein
MASMMIGSNIHTLIKNLSQLKQVDKDNQSNAKVLRSQLEELKSKLLVEMQQQNLRFLPFGDNLFAVVKKKTTKPTLNIDLIKIVLDRYMASGNIQCPPDFVSGFEFMLSDCITKMSATKDVLEFTEGLPVESLYT